MRVFAARLDSVLDRMRSLRPDLADADYDVAHDSGKLRVVDTDLDERSRIWLEESFNADPELGRLAGEFNALAVTAFDTGSTCETGHRRSERTYDELGQSIDRTTRFISVLKKISGDDPSEKKLPAKMDPFFATAAFLAKQIVNDTYAYQAKGDQVALMRNLEAPSFYGWIV